MTRTEWFTALAALAYPADPSKAGAAFRIFIPWFDDLPAAAFTRDSLHHVVTAPRKMAIPSYDEIRKPLAAWWWEQQRPPEQRLGQDTYHALNAPAPRRAPTDLEKHIAAETVQAFKASVAERHKAAPLDEKLRPKALPLCDQALLAEYERFLANPDNPSNLRAAASVRVSMLRQKMGAVPVQHAAE